MRPKRHAGGLIFLALLSGCASRLAAPQGAATQGAPARSGTAPESLYANGRLTALGEARLERAAKVYSAGNEALAYADFLGLAEQGHGESQYNLGVMDGDGVGGGAPDMPKAIAWLRKADAAGYPDALFQLGVYDYKGAGVPRDVPKAVASWRSCAARGNKDCAFNAGAVQAARAVLVPARCRAGLRAVADTGRTMQSPHMQSGCI